MQGVNQNFWEGDISKPIGISYLSAGGQGGTVNPPCGGSEENCLGLALRAPSETFKIELWRCSSWYAFTALFLHPVFFLCQLNI